MIKFEHVKNKPDAKLPVRSTAKSAGYDFFASEQVVIPSYKKVMKQLKGATAKDIPYSLADLKNVSKITGLRPTLVPTGVKCIMDDNMYLSIYSRSSIPLNDWLILANGVGIIDSDYANNPDNDGEISFQFINLSPVDIIIHEGDKIGQGIINTFVLTDDDSATGERTGGFGSTDGEKQ